MSLSKGRKDDLFQGTADYYAQYRSGYSPELPNVLKEVGGLDGSGRLLDLGTGTGVIALSLAALFDEVFAVDPDAEMLREATRIAKTRGIENVKFVHSRAEDMGPGSGTFRLITVGSAFHWMDRTHVIAFSHGALQASGILAIIGTSREEDDRVEGSAPPIPRDRIRAVVRRYLGPKRRAGSGFFQKPEERYEDLLDVSAFGHHCTISLPGSPTTRTIDEVVGFLYSTSYASRRLFGDEIESFESDLREELLAVSPTGEFSATTDRTEVIYAGRSVP